MTRLIALVVAYIALCWSCLGCQSSSDTPTDDWPVSPPEAQCFDSAALATVVEQVDAQNLPIDSLLVVRNGVLVLDAYFYPYLGNRPHDVASVT